MDFKRRCRLRPVCSSHTVRRIFLCPDRSRQRVSRRKWSKRYSGTILMTRSHSKRTIVLSVLCLLLLILGVSCLWWIPPIIRLFNYHYVGVQTISGLSGALITFAALIVAILGLRSTKRLNSG